MPRNNMLEDSVWRKEKSLNPRWSGYTKPQSIQDVKLCRARQRVGRKPVFSQCQSRARYQAKGLQNLIAFKSLTTFVALVLTVLVYEF